MGTHVYLYASATDDVDTMALTLSHIGYVLHPASITRTLPTGDTGVWTYTLGTSTVTIVF